jgi:hypothetical protein
MPMVATKKPYTLFIKDDTDIDSPRETDDCFGKMICFHRRYNLGDKHDFNEPRDFMHKLLYDHFSVNPKPLYDYIKQGNAKEARLEYNRSTKEWELLENNYWSSGNDWYTTSSYPASLGKDIPDHFVDDMLSALRLEEMTKLAEQINGLVILPLFLYDHSGITMNTAGFSCPWDSGQVGWIYAAEDDIVKEYGSLTPENMEKARTLLQGEVEYYDHYLRGDCYGFQLYKGDEELDSCWGFIGDPTDLQADIESYLPEDCKGIMNNLVYRYDDPDIDDILQEQADELEVG